MPNKKRMIGAGMFGGGVSFSPLDISDLRWLDPSRGFSSSGGITTWTDQSENGNDASVADANAPDANANAFGTGLSGIVFSAANSDYLSINSLATLISGSDKPWSVCFAFKMNAISADVTPFGFGKSGNNTPVHFLYNNSAVPEWWILRRDDAALTDYDVCGTPDLLIHIMTIVFGGTTVTVRIDGVGIITATAQNVGTVTLDTFTLAAVSRLAVGSFANITIGDFFFVPREFSASEIASLESFAAPRCGKTYPFDNPFLGLDFNIFPTAGQSNSSGRATNNQNYSGIQVAALFGNDYVVKTLADPTDSNSSQIDTVSDDALAAGSAWPLVANDLSDINKRIMFVPCAKGGASITEWQPGADHQDRTTLYGSMVYRVLQAQAYGTLRAVLLWEGETDALAGMSQATFNGHLDTFANAVKVDLGIPTIVCKLQACTGIAQENQDAINAAIAEAWADNVNVLIGPDLTGLTTDDEYHLKTNAKLLTAGGLWSTSIISGLGW